MELRYRWSALTHVFSRGGIHALYNSLKLRPIYVDGDVLALAQAFGGGATFSEVLIGASPTQSGKFQRAFPALCEAKILVDAESTDEDIIDFFRDHYLGHPYVSIAYFILTDACNLACKYCFVENRIPAGHLFRQMDVATVVNGLDFFGRLMRLVPAHFEEEKTIVLYGGEPLINIVALRVLLGEVAVRRSDGRFPQNVRINMVSNATLVTPEVARLLAENRVGVAVSLDGGATATNSARQSKDGTSVFDDACRGFDVLRAEGVDVGVSCTLTEGSLENFDATLEVLLERFQAKTLGFNILLSSDAYPLASGYDERASRAIIKGFEMFRRRNVFEDRMMRKLNAFTKGEVYPFDCGAAGGGQIIIAPDGAVGICHGYLGSRKYFMTTVDDKRFDPARDAVFVEWAQRSPLAMPQCRACPALGICGGGCPLNADHEGGSIWECDRRFCVHALATLEWLIWDLYRQMQDLGSTDDMGA